MLAHIAPKLATKKIVLGSSSPRRSYALQHLGLKFEIIVSTFEENLDKNAYKSPVDYVLDTALHKTKEIFSRVYKEVPIAERADLIVCADTIVVLGDQILGKPTSKEDAFHILSSLSGNKHSVHTAVCLAFPKVLDTRGDIFIHSFVDDTEVKFTKLNKEMIDGYIATGSPMDKAGAYGIQDVVGGSFVEGITGCYYNVTGFPVHRFCRELLHVVDLGHF